MSAGTPEVVAAALSDVGRERTKNEDALHVDREHAFFVVADGMGGEAAGDLASHMVVDMLRKELLRGTLATAPRDFLRDGIRKANARIFYHSLDHPEKRGMGSTVVALALARDRYFCAHAGDSRLYRVRQGRLQQLTEDHSLVYALYREGILTRQQMMHDSRANQISRAVGLSEELEATLGEGDTRAGDVFLLCSDGLHTLVEDAAIEEVLATTEDLDAAAAHLVQMANQQGGRDNVSVVAVRVTALADRVDGHATKLSVPSGLETSGTEPTSRRVLPALRSQGLSFVLGAAFGLCCGWLLLPESRPPDHAVRAGASVAGNPDLSSPAPQVRPTPAPLPEATETSARNARFEPVRVPSNAIDLNALANASCRLMVRNAWCRFRTEASGSLRISLTSAEPIGTVLSFFGPAAGPEPGPLLERFDSGEEPAEALERTWRCADAGIYHLVVDVPAGRRVQALELRAEFAPRKTILRLDLSPADCRFELDGVPLADADRAAGRLEVLPGRLPWRAERDGFVAETGLLDTAAKTMLRVALRAVSGSAADRSPARTASVATVRGATTPATSTARVSP